jgi:tetratricopeptide (TPR) repeat protein
MGDVYLAGGDYPKAREEFQKSVKLREALARASREEVRTQWDLVPLCWRLGDLGKRTARFAEAERWYQRAAWVVRDLMDKHQGQDRENYAKHLQSLERALTICTSAARAADDLEFALAQPTEVVPELLAIRIEGLLARGRHAEAAATADRLRERAPRDANTLYAVARAYARCVSEVARAKPPEQLAGAERQTRDLYAARVIGLLKEARAAGYFKTRTRMDRMEKDTAFTPLRAHREYRAVVEGLKKALR